MPAPYSRRHAHRLPPRDRLAAAQAWGLCQLPLPRGAVPRAVFRQAYDALTREDASRASRDYVELLGLAAGQGEDAVAAALGAALRQGELPRPVPIAEAVSRARGEPPAPPDLPALAPELLA